MGNISSGGDMGNIVVDSLSPDSILLYSGDSSDSKESLESMNSLNSWSSLESLDSGMIVESLTLSPLKRLRWLVGRTRASAWNRMGHKSHI